MSAPTAVRERALAPDLARGGALLGIAVANSVLFLRAEDRGPSFRPVDGGTADRVVDAAAALLVDNRSFPLFAALLGYGWWQVYAREGARGTPEPVARRLLARRSLVLVLLGSLHAALLFSGDVLGAYGLLSLGLLLLLRSSGYVLGAVAGALSLGLAVLGAFDGAGGDPGQVASEPWPAVADRLQEWGVGLVGIVLAGWGLLAPMVLGLLAARHRVLEEPERHLPLLRRTAVLGLALGVAGGAPLALTSTQVWQLSGPADVAVGALHGLTGGAMALGYGAVAGLLAARWRARGGAPRVARWVAAAGAVSLSCYLAESVALSVALDPWWLGLGERAGTAVAALVGVVAWVLVVAGAAAWRAGPGGAGRRPPAEALLRRLVYGRRRASGQPSGQPSERQGRARSAAT